MYRRQTNHNKEYLLLVRLTPEQKAEIKRAAELCKCKVSNLDGAFIYVDPKMLSPMNDKKTSKVCLLLIRVTPEQKQQLKQLAADEGCTVSKLVRKQFLPSCA